MIKCSSNSSNNDCAMFMSIKRSYKAYLSSALVGERSGTKTSIEKL